MKIGNIKQRPGGGESGFSLMEVLVTISITTLLLALAVPSLRVFWFKQSLTGGADAIVTEMRRTQSLVTSESHPLVYGLRLTDNGSWNADGKWGLVKYDSTGGAGGLPACTQYATGTLSSGIFNARVSIKSPDFDPGGASAEQSFCRGNLKSSTGTSLAASLDEFLFFYARGTATGGRLILHQPNLGAASDITIEVESLTGRADRV